MKAFVAISLCLVLMLAAAPVFGQGTPIQVRSGATGAIGNNVITPLGATTDAKCPLTDGTAEGAICILKEVSFLLQNALATTTADGGNATIGAKSDPKSALTDASAISLVSVLKELSFLLQNTLSVNASATPANANQPAATSDSTACATDIGCEISDGSGNKLTSNSTTYAAKHALDGNLLGTLGTAFSTPGKVDTKSADGDNATVGAKTDAANPAVDTTGVSVVAILKELSKLSQGSWAGGTLKSGAVTTAMTGTTSTSVIAGVASNYLYINQCTTSNASTTVSTDIILQDGSGGTTLYTIPAPAAAVATTGGGGGVFVFPTPLKVTTLANGLFAANVTTGSSTKISCSGFASTVSY